MIVKNVNTGAYRFFLCVLFSGVFSGVVSGQSADHITGKLQMSIPLGQLQANDISIPISIYNQGDALKVAVGEGDCGLGWGLSVGGGVGRIVRGLPDDVDGGWLFNDNAQAVQNFNPTADDNLSGCDANENTDYNAIDALKGGESGYTHDTEPDLFYINAPGLSAQFVFGADGIPKLLVHQDIVIQYASGNFTVTTSTGMVYAFNDKETINRTGSCGGTLNSMNTECKYYGNNVSFASQWKLTSITSKSTGTAATFYYTSVPQGASRRYLGTDSSSYMVDTYLRMEVQHISLKSYTASFSWSNSMLQQVTISESGTQDQKEFLFDYRSAFHKNLLITKAFLTGIRLLNDNCLASNNYTFEYKDITYPVSGNHLLKPDQVDWRRFGGQDFFGYPNSLSGNWNNPTLYFYNAQSDGLRLRVNPISGQSATTTVHGHDRSPSASFSYGALKKITYPTGGYVEIEYERNKYMDNSVSPAQEFIGGGMRVKKIISQGGEAAYGRSVTDRDKYRDMVREYEYLNASGSSTSGVLLSPIKLGYITASAFRRTVNNIGEDDPDVMYTRVREKVKGQGSTVYEFTIPGIFPETSWDDPNTIGVDWRATKSRIARKLSPCVSAGDIKNGYYTFPYAPSSNLHYKRGQLNRVTEYPENGTTAIREKIYTYVRKTTNPSTIKGLRFEFIEGVYHYGLYEIVTGNMEVISQEIVKESSQEDPSKWIQTTTDYAYNSYHLPQAVTTTLPNSTVTVRTFKYARDFQFTSPLSTDTAAVALKTLNDHNRGTALVEQITKVTVPGTPQTITDAQLILYRVFDNHVLPYYIKTLPQGASLTEAFMIGQAFTSDPDYRLVSKLKEYDSEGRILTATDDKKNYVATHYAINQSLPLATFSNINARNAVFEGFDLPSSFGLTASGSGIQSATGWTGQKATRMTLNTDKLISSSTNAVLKNGNKYRVSCWIYSVANKAITINAKNGSSTAGTLTLTNTISNKWNYLEGEMDMSGVASSFTLEVTTNATASEPVTIDDIIFMPAHGRVALRTALPFRGTTSVTDDHGNSVKTTFDHFGRTYEILDANRNVVQRNDYVVKNTKTYAPHASFISNTYPPYVDAPITFTPFIGTCDVNSTYTWKVDGVAKSNSPGNTLVHTFASSGQHQVELTVTNSLGVSASFYQSYCVEFPALSGYELTITDNNGNPVSSYDCTTAPNGVNVNLVGPDVPTGCTFNPGVTSQTIPDGSGGSTIIYTANYSVFCSANDCAFSASITGTSMASVTYIARTEGCP